MKKTIIIILLLVFGGLIFLNFFYEKDFNNERSDISNNETEVSKDNSTKKNEDSEQPVDNEILVFKDENIQEKYENSLENNEPLVVDVVIPSYYSDQFTEYLHNEFGDNVQFNRIDIDTNSLDIYNVDVYDNSDVVLLSALQIRDYDDEVLPDHNIRNVLDIYMELLNMNKTVVVLSEPNVYEHDNLENAILSDQSYMQEYDYYYVNNSDIQVDPMYNSETYQISKPAEKEIAKNVKKFLIQ